TVDGRKTDGFRLAWPETFAALMRGSADKADASLSFAIWQSFEPVLAANPVFWTDWLSENAAQFQPLARPIVHKAMRRLCDLRKPSALDLAIDFCNKIIAHDALLAHALEGLVKGQEGGV